MFTPYIVVTVLAAAANRAGRPKSTSQSNRESEREQACNDKSGNLHPTGVAKGERADRISQGIIVEARGALHDPRDSEQWTGDYAAYKECLCYAGDRAQDVLFCARLFFPGCQVSNDEYLSGFLSLTANPNLPPNERKLSHRWRGRALLRWTIVSSL